MSESVVSITVSAPRLTSPGIGVATVLEVHADDSVRIGDHEPDPVTVAP